jgi:hypothetical protein
MSVATRIERGKSLLDQGDEKNAARELTDAAVECWDPEQAMEIKKLADRGMEMAGRFGKSRWKEVARIADLHRSRATT